MKYQYKHPQVTPGANDKAKMSQAQKNKENAKKQDSSIQKRICLRDANAYLRQGKYLQAYQKYNQRLQMMFSKAIVQADTYWNLALCCEELASTHQGQEKEQYLHEGIEALLSAEHGYIDHKEREACANKREELEQTLTRYLEPNRVVPSICPQYQGKLTKEKYTDKAVGVLFPIKKRYFLS